MTAGSASRPGPAEGIAPESRPRRPVLVIGPDAGWPSLSLREPWRFRGLLLTFAGRELRVRYRQTALGVLWFVLQPLIMAATFTFVFGAVARMPEERTSRLVFTYAGVLAWNLFSQIVIRGSHSLVQNAPLLSKVYFPRELLPLSMVPLGLVDLAVALGLLVVILAVTGTAPTAAALLLPLWIVLLCVLGAGWALLTSALTVWYRDLQFVISLALQILLYLSPLAYSVSSVPERFRPFILLNPIAPLLEAFRWSLVGANRVSLGQLAYSLAFGVASFVAGLALFRHLERRFADVV